MGWLMRTADIERVNDWVPGELLAALRQAGGDREVHLVGGALRDRLLGRPSPDLDLVANGRGEKLGRRLARHLGGRFIALAGERFAAYRIVAGDLVVDLWGRGDTPIHDELERRDLTINSLAVDLAARRLLDPFGGVADLERRRLRATSQRSFTEDPLRVLRLARFGASLAGFAVDPPTLELARQAAARINVVAAERIRDEVDRILAVRGRAAGAEILVDCGLYPSLWGGAGAATGADRVPPRLAAIGATRDELCAETDPELCALSPTIVAHALLFSPPGGGFPAAAASSLLTRRARRQVSALLELDELPMSGVDEIEGRWFLRRWRRRWLEAVVFAVLRPDPPAATDAEAARSVAGLARRHGREIFDLPTLLDGHEIGRLLGLSPGPEIGRALLALEREQIAGRVETAQAARSFLLSERWRRESRP